MEISTPKVGSTVKPSAPALAQGERASAFAALAADAKFIAGIIGIVLLLTSLPYLFAYVTTPPDRQFMGIVQNAPDTGQYLAWMRESMRGILISNSLTSEPNPPAFFNLVFWLLGRLSLYTGIELVQSLQLFRLASGILFLLAAYYACAVFLPDRLYRRTAFCLIAFTSGFSLYATALSKFSAALAFFDAHRFTGEGNTLYSVMSFPLLVFGAFLITLIFAWAYIAYRDQRTRYALAASAAAFLLGWSHGYDLILIYAVLVAFSAVALLRDGWRAYWVKYVALLIAVSSLPALYMVYLTRSNATWRDALAQYVNAGVFSPDPFSLILLMGLPLLLALATFQGIADLKGRALGELFVTTWFAVQFLLIYLPVSYQIHFINSWQVPISILATLALFRFVLPLLSRLKVLQRVDVTRQAVWLSIGFVLLVVPSNLYFVGWRVLDMTRRPQEYFFQRAQVAALDWLRENTQPEEVVLSSYEIGHYLPGLSGNRAYLAHWAMTLDFFSKRETVQQFFDPATSDNVRVNALRQYDVHYIYWSDAERRLGAWNPDDAAYLERVWSEPDVAIYRVKY